MEQAVFDAQHKNLDAFNVTLKKLSKYIARTTSNSREFIQALNFKNLWFEELVELDDPPDKASVIKIEKWKVLHKNWNAKHLQYEEANKAAYTIILAQCPKGVSDKMKRHDEWETAKNNLDAIGLAKFICKVMYSGMARKSLIQTCFDTEMTSLIFRQKRHQSNSKYFKMMKTKIELFEQLGGEPGMFWQQIATWLLSNNVVVN